MLSREQWEAKRPLLMCIDEKGWAAIRRNWELTCIDYGRDCNVELESVDKLVKQFDDLVRQIFEGR